ncbi:MAG: FecR domain-containing protein [Petrimonas sp.]|nr:FecR domain-containing protein [Petrimonas sp.]
MNTSDKKILQKVIEGTSSPENARCVAEWFSSSIEGQQTLSDMMDKDAYLMEENRLKEINLSPVKSKMMFAGIDKSIRRKRLIRSSWRVAAVLLPFVVLIGIGFYLNKQVDLFGKSAYTEIYIPKGESRTRIVFQDGSEVYLNADTRLRYPKKFGMQKRHVYLQGEAYFNVASNKNRPFFVHTDETFVKVLGTSFNVKAYDDDNNIYVTLDEGKVTFNTALTQYAILSGHEIVYDKKSRESFVHRLPESTVMSLWKEDVIYLRDTPLFDVLQMLERRYDVVFEVNNQRVYNYSYTLTTHQTSVEGVLRELEKIAPVKFREQDGKIIVSLS